MRDPRYLRHGSPPRRGLRRTDAAAYIGLSSSKFDMLVKDGRMPEPFSIDGCRVWDIFDLDDAFDALKAASGKPRYVLDSL